MFLSAQRANFFSAVGKILNLETRKNEPEIKIEMKFSRVLKTSLDGCQKIIPRSDPTRVKIWDTSIAVGTIRYHGFVCRYN